MAEPGKDDPQTPGPSESSGHFLDAQSARTRLAQRVLVQIAGHHEYDDVASQITILDVQQWLEQTPLEKIVCDRLAALVRSHQFKKRGGRPNHHRGGPRSSKK